MATKDASKFFLNLIFWGAFMITFQVKECPVFLARWFAGSDFRIIMFGPVNFKMMIQSIGKYSNELLFKQ